MKYSVIIPVYNAEKTIKRCLDSLIGQNFENIEILLVNDGSIDRSGNICREYAKRYGFVRYFEKKNGGVSSARNLGLDYAEGEYILFVDSDDWVSNSYFKTIDTLLTEDDYDYVIFSHYIVSDSISKEVRLPYRSSDNTAKVMSYISEAMCRKYINSPWAKVYRRKIIKEYNLRFNGEISIGEDRAFNLRYVLHIESIVVSDKLLYYVDIGNGSSLSRIVHFDLDEQIKKAENYVLSELEHSDWEKDEKEIFIRAHHFDLMRTVYTKAKYLHKLKKPYLCRLKEIYTYCKAINKKHYRYPISKYCILIHLPVRFYMIILIDAMAWYLTG